MARLTREERKARRRRILKAAVQLGRQLYPDDDDERREWLVGFISSNVDIPGIGPAMERKIIALIADLIDDLFEGETNG